MRMARTLCCTLVALLLAQAAMAQEDLKALNAEKKKLTRSMQKIRVKLRKSNKDIAALYDQMAELRKKIDEAYMAASEDFKAQFEQRAEIVAKIKALRPKKERKHGRKKKKAEGEGE